MHGEETVETKTKVKTSAPRDVLTPKKIVKRKSSTTEDFDRVFNPLPPPNKAKSTIPPPAVATVRPEDVTTIDDPSLLKAVLKSIIRSKCDSLKVNNDSKGGEELRQLEEKQTQLRAEDEKIKKTIQDIDQKESSLSRITSTLSGKPTQILSQDLEKIVTQYEKKKTEIAQLDQAIKQIESDMKAKEEKFKKETIEKSETLKQLQQKRVEVGNKIQEASGHIRAQDATYFKLVAKLGENKSNLKKNQTVIDGKQEQLEKLKQQDEEKESLIQSKFKEHEIKLDVLKKTGQEIKDLADQNTAIRQAIEDFKKREFFQTATLLLISTLTLGFVVARYFFKK